MNPLLESLREGFHAQPAARVDAHGLGDLRRGALLRTLAEGLPGPRSESWKYTPLRALAARRFLLEAESPRLHPAALVDVPGPRLVFVNGRLDGSLSLIADLPPGLHFTNLAVATGMVSAPAPAGGVEDAFAHLNLALANDGVIIEVAAGMRIDMPLHLVFVGAPASADLASHLRHSIVLGDGAKATLVEHHFATDAHRHLANHWTAVTLGAKAELTHARLQDEDDGATLLARTDATLAHAARYQRIDLELGASLSRQEINVVLRGAGARVVSGGALLAGGRRHLDTRLVVEHAGLDTACDLLWRGLAADRGRVAFHGGITILAGADGSDARLSNKNLLLSDNAEIDTQPALQIHADEVKAAHGATIGRLDETALFYLRSRGIPLAQARALLTLAFCREALASMGDAALIQLLSPRMEARLAELETTP